MWGERVSEIKRVLAPAHNLSYTQMELVKRKQCNSSSKSIQVPHLLSREIPQLVALRALVPGPDGMDGEEVGRTAEEEFLAL